MTEITPHQLELARNYAAWITARDPHREDARAAAEVITALPDGWIDADRVRAIIQPHLEREVTAPSLWRLVKDLEALLPAPKPRTLADMTPEERENCRWRHADIAAEGHRGPGIILIPTTIPDGASVILPNGMVWTIPHNLVVPDLDTKRVEWPNREPVTEEPTPTRQERLVTEEDYRNAPTGTVVWGKGPSSGDDSATEKYGNDWLEPGNSGTYTPREMSDHGPHQVLRWGGSS